MKHLLFETGGRPLNNDDFTTFQDEVYYSVNGQLQGLPACVVAGCSITAATANTVDISAGLVYIDGEIRRFEGAGGVTLPQELFTDTFTTTELRAYQTGGSKATMGEAVVLARPFDVASLGEKVKVVAEGVLRVAKAREGLFREVGEGGFMFDYSANDYDTSGRGKYGTKAYGWALIPAMGGRVAVGVDPTVNDYSTTRKIGGADSVQLTGDQNGPHTHNVQQAGAHTHTYDDQSNREDNIVDAGSNTRYIQRQNQTKTTSSAGNHAHVLDSAGLGEAHENRQRFMTVLYRIWAGF